MGQQRFQIQFDFNANMGPVKASVADLQKSLAGLNLPPTLATNFEKLFGKLGTEMAEFEAMTKNGFTNMADVNKAQTSFARITRLLSQIGVEVSKVKGLEPEKLLPKEVQTRLSSLTKKFSELKAQQDKKDGFADKIAKQNKAIKEQETEIENLKTKRKALAKENVEAGAAKGQQAKKKSDAEATKGRVVARMTELEGTRGGKGSAEYKDLSAQLTQLNGIIRACDNEMARLTTTINKNKGSMAGLDGDIDAAETTLANLRNELKSLESVGIDPKGLQAFRQELATLRGVSLDEIPTDLKEIETLIDQIGQSSLAPVITQTEQVEQNFHDVDNAADGARNAIKGTADSAQHLNRAAQDVENLKNQVYQFFSLTNSVQLFKRAVTSAMNTVKELDATMTEAAVVTEFSVGDMWDRLPEYSANAQKLGVSINGMYQATTLYYQQGLKTNEAMALGVETMKMAKIAGMESAEATEAMTAALRGFNMELNETSAVRVNDVYSQLAAITAADTSQIATAMEKTASIAASANMEFETTAALLAQIIETTQEAPETAGTALKTIIARFSEVKKLQAEGQSTGQDSEGEIIDVNKIQTALRTVGISMEGFFQGTEGLDSVLLKLAEKWDTLDFGTQRYIATMAAGSRQQSRFLAMMSDYSRTTELVSQANNSAGASQNQFNKTLDSMESKLQKLENAWNEFLMGLSNNEILKGAVDTLTMIITGINKITDAISGGNGLVKSIVSLATVLGALKLGKSLLGGALGSGLGWAGQKMGMGGQSGADPQQPGQAPTGGQPTPMPNPQGSGDQAGTGWGTGFLAAVLKKLDAGRHTVEAKAESLAGTDEGQAAGEKQGGGSKKATRTRNRYEKKAQKNLKKQHGGTGRARKGGNDAHVAQSTEGYLKSIEDLNKETEGFDMAPVRAEFEKTYAKTGDLGKAMDAAGAKTRELGGTKMSESEKTKMMNDATNGLSSGLSGAGMAAMAAGAAINALGALFEKLGMDEAAEACNWVGTALMGVGAALMMLPGLITGVASVATAAGISVQAAWWWLLIIMAVIISIIALVYILCKAFEAASESAQLEKMNEQLEDLSAAADEAKKKLDDMAAAKDELRELGNAFDGLVKGSQEWKEALIENNQKVLDLLNTYPQLAAYVEKGLHGELTITDEGFEVMMNQQQEAYTAALGAKTAMTSQIDAKEAYIGMENTMAEKVGGGGKKDYADFADTGWGKAALIGGGLLAGAGAGAGIGAAIGTAIAPGIGTAIGGAIGTIAGVIGGVVAAPDPEDVEREQTGGLTYDEMNKFASLAAERGLSNADGSLDKEAAQGLLDELGYSVESIDTFMGQIDKLGSSFDDLANQAMQVTLQERAKVDATAASVAASSAEVQQSEDYAGVAEEMGAQAFDDYGDRVAKGAETKLGALDDKNMDSDEAVKVLQDYADMNGMTVEEVRKKIEDGELSKETVANTVSAAEVNKQMEDAMKGTIEVLEGIEKKNAEKGKSKQEMEGLKSLLTDRGEGMNVGAMKDIQAMGGDVEAYLKSQGFEGTDAEAQKMGFENWDAYVKAMESNYKTGTQGFEEATAQFQKMGIELTDLPDGVTAGLADGLAKKLSLVAATHGDGMAKDIMAMYGDITKNMSTEDVEKFTSYMNDVDWSNADEVKQFQDSVKEMGLNIPADQMEAFTQKMVEAGNATRKLTFEQAIANMKEIQKIIQGISTGEVGRSFSQEQYDAIIAADSDLAGDFVQDIDGEWKYIGNSMGELTKALKDNTQALLGGTMEQYQAKAQVGEIVEGDIQTNLQKVGSGGVTDAATAGNYLKAFIDKAKAEGMDVANLGIEGLTNDTDVSKLSLETMKAMSNQILDISANSAYYQSEITEKSGQAEFTAKRNDEAGMLIAGVYDSATENTLEQISGEKGVFGVKDTSLLEHIMENATIEKGENQEQDEKDLATDFNTLISKYKKEGKDISELGIEGLTNDTDASKIDYTKLQAWANELQRITTISETNSNVLKAQAVQYGVSEGLIKRYNKAMEGADAAEKEAAAAALANAISQKKSEQAYGRTLKKLGDVKEEYGDLAKGMDGYEEMLWAYGDALNIDMTDATNYDFVAENMDLVRQAAEGDIDAIMRLNELLAKEHGFKITADGNLAPLNAELATTTDAMNDFIQSQIDAGSYELVSITAEQDVKYLVPTADGKGYEYKTFEAGTTIQTIKPKSAPAIDRAQNYGGAPKKESDGGADWENPYDEFYNSVKKLNAELRKRTQIEREYQRLLDRNAATAEKLIANTKDQLASYAAEKTMREGMLQNRKNQMADIESENSKYSKYAWYDEKLGQVQIDWNALEGLKKDGNAELQEKVTAYIDKLEEQQGLIEEEQDQLDDINDGVWSIYQQGKDSYFSLEDRIKEAIVSNRQEEIDKLSTINDTISTTNSDLLTAMQDQLSEYRQARDNEKTEKDLEDKQRKLAYLSQDTSGANAKDIMTLQKEIDEAEQSYTDQLIDQKISELQAQNDEASEQRQKQIDIMQAQLDHYVDSGQIWAEVKSLMETGLSETNGLVTGSKLESLLKSADAFEGLSKMGQMDWLNSLNSDVAQALGWLKTGAMQTMFGEGKEVTFKDKDGKTITGTVDKEGNVVTKYGTFKADTFSMDSDGNVYSSVSAESFKKKEEPKKDEKPKPTTNEKKGVSAAILRGGLGWGTGQDRRDRLKEVFGASNDVQSNYVNKYVTSGFSGSVSDYSYDKMKKKFVAYKTGGLADFTGPAWLDGTKSKPEYILNADQTKAFFTLVDVLSALRAMPQNATSTENHGDNVYDIDINVESIGNDYDVEQMAETIKRLINDDARYRNNNAINLMR